MRQEAKVMSTHGVTRAMTAESSRSAGFVGAYYLLTIAIGAFILFFHGRLAFLADFSVGVLYLGATAFLYVWSLKRRKNGRKQDL